MCILIRYHIIPTLYLHLVTGSRQTVTYAESIKRKQEEKTSLKWHEMTKLIPIRR